MSKHTPGPWKNDGKKLITTVGIVISKDKSLGPIAVVSEENAPIVLAAPEMYEALTAILDLADSDPFATIGMTVEHGKGANIRALLARIEGEK